MVPVGDGPLVPVCVSNRDQRVWPPAAAWAPPFGLGLCLKPGPKAYPYIYGALPPNSLVFFLAWEVGVGFVQYFFSSYALEVFGEMPLRTMSLVFTQDKYDMSCKSHP